MSKIQERITEGAGLYPFELKNKIISEVVIFDILSLLCITPVSDRFMELS